MTLKIIGYALLITVMLSVLGFVATGGNFVTYKFWAPKQANAERQVFEQTQSYVQGKVEYITRLRYEYFRATGPEKQALARLILDEASTIDNSKLPVDLQTFISNLKNGGGL